MLAFMPNLRRLDYRGHADLLLPQHEFSFLRSLPKLEALSLKLEDLSEWEDNILEPLRHLTALTSFHLMVSRWIKSLVISPALGQLTKLVNLRLEREEVDMEPADQAHLMQSISRLTSLTDLSLHSVLEDVPSELTNLASLVVMHLGPFPDGVPCKFPATLAGCSSLERLSLSGLLVASCRAWEDVCASILSLPALQALEITDTDLYAVPASAWKLSTQLTQLRLDTCELKTIPQAVSQLPLLRNFVCRGQLLSGLPTGPYLSNLRNLEVTVARAGAGPEALANAKQLETLAVILPWKYANVQVANRLWRVDRLKGILPPKCLIRSSW